MSAEPVTRATLLLRIRDRTDHESWRQFVDVYAPVLLDYATRKGLQYQDASDVIQEVMRSVAKSIQRFEYDPKEGRFRGWLYTLTRNHMINYQKRNAPHQGTGDSVAQELLNSQPDRADEDEVEWNSTYHRNLLKFAMQEVEKELSQDHWTAFLQTAVEGQNASAVAESLNLSVGHVYVLKSRVVSRIRERVEELGGVLELADA